MIPDIQKITETMIQSILDWHKDLKPTTNPYEFNTFLYLIYKKNHIDTIQWHVEDEIRRPDLPALELVKLKREIDKLNQERTDTVELLDDKFLEAFRGITLLNNARMNSETPAWLLDRMSILELKIYHMDEETKRKDAGEKHIETCQSKLHILLTQRADLQTCFQELVDDLKNGKKFMKVYRQMKMYNDEKLNPALYGKK